MILVRRWATTAAALLLTASPLAAQTVQHLSLKDAEQQALAHHPQVLAGEYRAQAGSESVREA
ncbi:MAG TPA: hypothetical protein VG222_15415, partial [Vicinamibacterales bacterium]|nr:hypothetical protein [Vicinamibacterales bacterium]